MHASQSLESFKTKSSLVIINHKMLLPSAMLEALQQEEYKEERAHVRLMDDDEEDFVVHQADPG